jgi:hypothetical protein
VFVPSPGPETDDARRIAAKHQVQAEQ